MPHRDIVVIGGSAGSLDPLKVILGSLPAHFPASIFVVIHLAVDSPSMLADQLSKLGPLPATQPTDGELIRHSHIYIARPDYHLTLESGRIRVQRGARENRHRPAIDPLFRTAARQYGRRVIGVILSGYHDDGSAGLYAVKQFGGIAIVQDPKDASVSQMPSNALAYATPDLVLRTGDIAPNLIKLVQSREQEGLMPSKKSNRKSNSRRAQDTTKQDTTKQVATKQDATKRTAVSNSDEPNLRTAYSDEGEGTPSVFACPECHGVLWELRDNKLVRFRCRVGHSFTTDTLGQELSQASENALWAAMRALEEKAALERRVAASLNPQSKTAGRLRDQSAADDANARLIRDMIFRRDAKLEDVHLQPEQSRASA